MKAHRWSEVEELFLEAVDREPALRVALLDQRCVDNPGLRAEVESLLAEHDHGSNFMEAPAFEAAGDWADVYSDAESSAELGRTAVGRFIGPYLVTRVIAAGGMGIVFEAEQRNPRRAVALKVVRGGAYVDNQRLRLFEREIRSLARLRHSAIAAIHEAGRTEDGEHYFAMELVGGEPLDAYVRSRTLSIRQRLELFCRICEGVAYAHQRGVIHRDLKPANVLIVDEDQNLDQNGPVIEHSAKPSHSRGDRLHTNAASICLPKILDFGLARITDVDVSATMASAAGRIQGTLAYMSPEQARGDPDAIDVRSDVYSLGVMLFELLTQRLPYDVQHASLPDALRIICEQPPRRPGAIAPALRGELETIVLKTLEKEPDRRYATVAALSDDIERYLANQPILARPPSAVYQIRKLVARHRTVSGLCAVMVILLITLAVTTRLQAERAEAAGRQATDEANAALDALRQADEIGHFMERLLFRITSRGNRRQIDAHDPEIIALLDALEQTIEHDLDGQPKIEALARDRMANVMTDLGLYKEAEAQMVKALELRRQALGERHPDVTSTVFGLANLAGMIGDFDSRQARLTDALRLARQESPQDDAHIAILLNLSADLLRERGNWPAAAEFSREADGIHRRIIPGLALGDGGLARGPDRPTAKPDFRTGQIEPLLNGLPQRLVGTGGF